MNIVSLSGYYYSNFVFKSIISTFGERLIKKRKCRDLKLVYETGLSKHLGMSKIKPKLYVRNKKYIGTN